MANLVIGIIGAGGKTTAMTTMAQQCREQRILVTTTTHIFPMTPPQCRQCLKNPTPEEVKRALEIPGILCAGTEAKEGKLGGLPLAVLEQAMAAADVALYEGDGAHRRPLKLHRPGEPVLLPHTDRCLILAGLSALAHPVEEVIHRYDRKPHWRTHPQHLVDTGDVLTCILEAVEASGMPREKLRVFLNQADVCSDPAALELLISQIHQHGLPVWAGSLGLNAQGLYDWVTADAAPCG